MERSTAIGDPQESLGVDALHTVTTTADLPADVAATGSTMRETTSFQQSHYIPTGTERVLLQSLRHNLVDRGDLCDNTTVTVIASDADVDPLVSIRYYDEDDEEAHFHVLDGGSDADADFYQRIDETAVSPPIRDDHRSRMTSSIAGYERILDAQHQCIMQIQSTFLRHREQWQHSGVVLQDLYRAPGLFNDHLVLLACRRNPGGVCTPCCVREWCCD